MDNKYLIHNSQLVAEWDLDANKDIDLNQITYGSDKVVNWICTKGHRWKTQVRNRTTLLSGCPFCSGRLPIVGETDLATLQPDLSREWLFEKNGTLTPKNVTCGSGKKAWWECSENHQWQATIASRVSGRGCPECAKKKRVAAIIKSKMGVSGSLADNDPNLSKEWNIEKNESLTPNDFLAYSGKKVWWICKRGHEWRATIASRFGNHVGCPECSKELKTSFPEQAIYFYLSQCIQAENRSRLLGKEVDIYLPSINCAIEYDGRYFHSQSKVIKADKAKTMKLSSEHIRLIRIIEAYENKVDDDIVYYVCKASHENLPWVIHQLVDKLNLSLPVQVDIERDRMSIFEQYIEQEKANSLAVKYPELLGEWNHAKNGRIKPEMVSFSSGKLVWWICKNGHEWIGKPQKRIQGKGCPICAGKHVLVGYNDLLTLSPAVAKQWHPIKNGELQPQSVTPGSGRKVWWICAQGHEWRTQISNRTYGYGCPICGRKQQIITRNADIVAERGSFGDNHPDLLAEWDYTKNIGISPDRYSSGSHKTVYWKCNKSAHPFRSAIKDRVRGNGCPICNHKQIEGGVSDLKTLDPELTAEWNYPLNGELKPEMVGRYSDKKVWWSCSNGHAYEATVSNRSIGRQCPYCSGKKVLAGYNDLCTTHPEIAKQWNYQKNENLTPQQVSKGSNKQVWWKCDICGYEWKAMTNSRTGKGGTGCPKCARKKNKD